MKPTCIKYTNTYEYNFQICGFPRLGGAGYQAIKINYIRMRRTGVLPVKKGIVFFALLLIFAGGFTSFKAFSQDIPQNISILLETLQPLSHDRDKRELIYQYSVGDLSS